jgi:DNA polymerase-1
MSTTLLIDADTLVYKVAHVSQREYQWPDCDAPSVALNDEADVVEAVDREISWACRTLDTSEVIVCLSCPTVEGWRRAILPAYKAQRNEGTRPHYFAFIREYLEKAYPTYRRDTLEADDIMGILSTSPSLVKGRKVIVSIDKDMETIPGFLFNPNKDTRKPRLVSEAQADYRHLFQTLVGDTTDNYKGCPGVGPVKATATLDAGGPATAWQRVVNAFVMRGLTEADALLQARVARICRHTDYDFKRKEVILWKPATTPV